MTINRIANAALFASLSICPGLLGCSLGKDEPPDIHEAAASTHMRLAAGSVSPEAAAEAKRLPLLGADPTITTQNEYIQIAEETTSARFTLGNVSGDPANPDDDNRILLFGHPTPWSSFTTLRIDGSDVVFGDTSAGTFTEVPTVYGTYIKSVWVARNVQVTQVLELSPNPSTGRVDAMQIRYLLKNIDQTNGHNIGLRVLLDTMLGSNDGAPFQVPGTGAVTTEREFVGAAVTEYWQAFDSLQHPTVVSQQTLRGSNAVAPDRLLFASWPDIYSTLWDYSPTPGKIFGSVSYPDSSVGLYWNPKAMLPNDQIEYVTYYGLSGLSQSMLPPVAISLGAPLTLGIDASAYSPNPFTVTAYAQNITADPIADITLRLDLPAGLSLPADSAVKTIAALAPNETGSISWQVLAANQTTETLLSYSITASASGMDDRQVTRSVTLPALGTVYDTGFRANPNGYRYANYGLDNLPWTLFRATYGADEVEVNGQQRPTAVTFFNSAYTHVARGGSCFGMASSSSILFQSSFDGWPLGTSRNNSLDAVGEPYTDSNGNGSFDAGEAFTDENSNGIWDSVRTWGMFPSFLATASDWVEYYHTRQCDAAVAAQLSNGCVGNCAYAALKQRIASGRWLEDPMVMAMWWPGAGHAVVPYRIEESADLLQADVRVYDNNFPNSQRTVHFDLAAGTATDADYNGGNPLLQLMVIDLSSIQAEPQMARYDIVTAGAHLLFTDSSGHRLGYVGDQLVEEIPGTFPVRVLAQTAGSSMPESYYIAGLDLRREVHGLTTGEVTVSVLRPNALAEVSITASPTSVDEVRVPPDGSSLEVLSTSGSPSVALSLDAETPDYARRVRFDGFGIEPATSVRQLFDATMNSIGFVNSGSPKNVALQIEQIGSSAGTYQHPTALEMAGNLTAWITPNDWSDLPNTYLRIDEDAGSDGTVDRTRVVTALRVDVKIEPATLNLKSAGAPITAYIELPAGYSVASLLIPTVQIATAQGRGLSIPITTAPPSEVGDHDSDGNPDLMVKFPRASLVAVLVPGSAEIGLLARLASGQYVTGTANILAQ